ncbi:glycosyltransferase family 61 protein [Alteromonas halophila]|uniref:Glycosyltransferase 61 catalytic domain-containing protein n=1 Tax=Alteromonas halophila TaxID=516698 RepID=A0A918JRI5_9ALTE|nr:glycosyltransferase family 61 protein [Alteromonas halophila]GGW92570.1 hypothetical protein GCM10007391_28690 [Alteromonas halophila]
MNLSKVSDLQVLNQFNQPDYGDPVEVLSPVEQRYDLDFVKDISSDSESREDFSRPLPPENVLFPSVKLRQIENAFVTDAFLTFDEEYVYTDTILKGGLGSFKHNDALNWSQQKISKTIDNISYEFQHESVLVVHNEGGGTWGHHLIQNFPKILFIKKHFPHIKIALPKGFCSLNMSQGKLLNAYGIDRDSIIPLSSNTSYLFKSVYILDFLFEPKSGFIHPWALDALRSVDILLENTHEVDRLFIKRLKKREIENRSEVEALLEQYHYQPFTQAHANLDSQIANWGRARSVVATLGSDMTNMVFLPDGASILSLSPDWFGDRFFFNLACAANINWFELRCGKVGKESESHQRFNNFFVDKPMLEQKIRDIGELAK